MRLICLILAAGAALAQTTRYPAAIDSDSSLFVVSDNVQTTLSTAMAIADTAAVVASAAGFAPNMIATICDTSTSTGKCTAWEHMLVTGVTGNVLTVTRGFAGTSARTHSSGRTVNILIDSAHQKVLKDSVVAIETALGPNLSNITATGPLITAGSFNFSSYSCNSSSVCVPGGASGMSLIAGNNSLTMTPVPNGVNGTDTGHALYISGGTGTAEACTITGGSGTSGQPSGQIIVNCANAHSGAWTLASASGGIQEAVCSLPAAGGSVITVSSVTLAANVTPCGKGMVTVQKQTGASLTGAHTVLSGSPTGTAVGEVFAYPTQAWASVQAAAPASWTGLAAGLYAGQRVSINNLPIGVEYISPSVSAIDGAIDGPTTAFNGQAFGLTGNARSNYAGSTGGTLAVGVFGSSYIGVQPVTPNVISIWGANFAANNCPNAGCSDGQGFNLTNNYGIEIDMNLYKTTGGLSASNAWGLWITGGSTHQPAGIADGIAIGPMGTFTTPATPWKNAIELNDGAGVTGLLLGTLVAGNNNGSMPILLTSRDAGGTVRRAQILTDSGGDLVFRPGTGSFISFQDSGGNSAAGVVPNGSTPSFSVTNNLTMGAAAPIIIPSIKSTTGQRYVCVTTSGQLVSSASACSGT